jgi:hypothetical protein
MFYIGLYLSPGKETLLSLQISAINLPPDAVTFYSPGKQRNCYLNTDFQSPIFALASHISSTGSQTATR